jgi:hypothetical protein
MRDLPRANLPGTFQQQVDLLQSMADNADRICFRFQCKVHYFQKGRTTPYNSADYVSSGAHLYLVSKKGVVFNIIKKDIIRKPRITGYGGGGGRPHFYEHLPIDDGSIPTEIEKVDIQVNPNENKKTLSNQFFRLLETALQRLDTMQTLFTNCQTPYPGDCGGWDTNFINWFPVNNDYLRLIVDMINVYCISPGDSESSRQKQQRQQSHRQEMNALVESIKTIHQQRKKSSLQESQKMQRLLHYFKNPQKKQIKVQQQSIDIPDYLVDPISAELFHDPVIAIDGHTYQRKSAQEIIRRHGLGYAQIPIQGPLITSYGIRKAVDDFKSHYELDHQGKCKRKV